MLEVVANWNVHRFLKLIQQHSWVHMVQSNDDRLQNGNVEAYNGKISSDGNLLGPTNVNMSNPQSLRAALGNGYLMHEYLFYRFIDTYNNLDEIDPDYELENVEGENDIVHSINRCQNNNELLNKLYGALCNKFESSKNYIKYDKYVNKMGQNDALKHSMKRHTFIHMLNYGSNVHNYTLNRFCQTINYNKSAQSITYNYGSLSHFVSCSLSYKSHYKTPRSHTLTGQQISHSNSWSSTDSNDTMSITLSSKHARKNDTSIMNLEHIHETNINAIESFAGLSISISGIVSNNSDHDVHCILHRILPDYQKIILSMSKRWDNIDYKLCILYDLEGYIGLSFYKTIGGIFESKREVNEIPIEDLKECEYDVLDTSMNNNNNSINWSEIYLQIDEENKQKCIETSDCIFNEKDKAFTKDLNLFNVFTWYGFIENIVIIYDTLNDDTYYTESIEYLHLNYWTLFLTYLTILHVYKFMVYTCHRQHFLQNRL